MMLHEIETARLRLRPFRPNDVDDFHQLLIDPNVRKYLCDVDTPTAKARGILGSTTRR
ncbi:MAG: GNAT family N-acetyltransferase [Tolypothrix sp. T3-bin4]|nr:GNAT family N-acetyltransferase [Tolypothrix sp. T3-bin4]